MNNLIPSYRKERCSPLNQSNYSLRNQDAIVQIRQEQKDFNLVSFLTAHLNGIKIRLPPSIAVFRNKFPYKICRPAKSVFRIHHPIGLSYLFQIWVALNELNFQKCKHDFKDTVNLMCPTAFRILNTIFSFALYLQFEDENFSLDFRWFYTNGPFYLLEKGLDQASKSGKTWEERRKNNPGSVDTLLALQNLLRIL